MYRKDKFESKTKFLAITLVQACHGNKKASDLISTVSPGDWKSIWKILLLHYNPMGAANKVDLIKGFMKTQKSDSESLTEFIARFENEMHDLTFQGVIIAEELAISILQQGLGSEHETYIRILVQQKNSFEKIREDLLTYESIYKTDKRPEIKYVTTTTLTMPKGNLKTNRSAKFQSKIGNNKLPNASNNFGTTNRNNKSNNTFCHNCGDL